MRVCIVGLGGVGGYIAAKFAQSGIDVVGVARGEHFRAIQNSGLKIIEDEQSSTADIHVQTTQTLEGVFDVVVFCVKNYDLRESALAVKQHLHANTLAISLSNGVDNAFILQNTLPNAKILQGCVYILSFIQKPGVIRKKGNVFSVVFGAQNSEKLVELFEKSNLRYKVSLDIQKDLWKKYIFISAFANLTCYYDCSIKEVVQNHYDKAKSFLEEIVLLAKTKGIAIEKEVQKSLQVAQNLPSSASTSMHKDCKNNNKTEYETLTNYLLKEAKKATLTLPTIEATAKEVEKKCNRF